MLRLEAWVLVLLELLVLQLVCLLPLATPLLLATPVQDYHLCWLHFQPLQVDLLFLQLTFWPPLLPLPSSELHASL